jgi:hypothetical protein
MRRTSAKVILSPSCGLRPHPWVSRSQCKARPDRRGQRIRPASPGGHDAARLPALDSPAPGSFGKSGFVKRSRVRRSPCGAGDQRALAIRLPKNRDRLRAGDAAEVAAAVLPLTPHSNEPYPARPAARPSSVAPGRSRSRLPSSPLPAVQDPGDETFFADEWAPSQRPAARVPRRTAPSMDQLHSSSGRDKNERVPLPPRRFCRYF